MFAERTSEIWKRIENLVIGEGFNLYDLEILSGGLKVTLKSKNGVTSGDCSRICKRLIVLASVEGSNLGIGSQPHIEVNSPGINRVLRVTEHYQDAVGERVKLVLHASDSFPAELVGDLLSFDQQLLKVETEEGTKKNIVKKQWEVPLALVKKARTDFKF